MKRILLTAFPLSLVIVSILTRLSYVWLTKLLFFLLYPGVVLALLITGGHGGTLVQERLALAASVLVNTLAYAIVYTLFLWIWRRQRPR